jgi:hypothetical protein
VAEPLTIADPSRQRLPGRPFPAWCDFVEQYWEKEPGAFRDVDTGFRDERAIFDGILCAAEELRAGSIRDHRDVSFHLANSVVVDPGPYLPRDSESLESYLTRLDASVAGRPFTLLINNFQEFSHSLCVRLRLFARHLLEHVRLLPAGTVSSHLMLARYAVSPFAVHKDPNSVFTFMIRGRKTLRVWPFEAFADRTRDPFARHRQLNLYDFDYRPFQASGTPLIGEPGDVLYWPSTYWHVGESTGEAVHISLHLTLDLHSEPRGEALDLLHRVVEASLTDADWHSGYPVQSFHDSGLLRPPTQLMAAVGALAQATQDTIEDSVTALWLSRMSAQGFWTLAKRAAPITPAAVEATRTVLQADPVFPVYWTVSGGSVTLAAHGQVIRFPTRIWTDELLAALAAHRPFGIAELTSVGMDERNEAAALATRLVAMGALHTVDVPCSTSAS